MPSIGLLTHSIIADDPRVRRQGDAFHAAGWKVWGVGLAGGRSAQPAWEIVGQQNDGAFGGKPTPALPPRRAWRRSPPVRQAARAFLALQYLRSRSSLGQALAVYWSFRHFRELYQDARQVRPDIWIANDWNTLPIAARLAEETGTPFGYDTHEFATTEYEERATWRLLQRPMVRLIEGRYIRQAICVSAVSSGISTALKELYGLPDLPMTVVNAPYYSQSPFHPTEEPARVLYHGGVTIGRGLEQSIESVAGWRDRRTLTIRGPVDPHYQAALEAIADRFGVRDRVTFDPPVATTALVEAARPFDIGLLALPAHSRHNDFALPNKLFEYAMAGLALCMTDLPEMARLINGYGMGVTLPNIGPGMIADAINGMRTEDIDRYKQKALAAASDLCWENVSHQLIDRYASSVRDKGLG